jgi:hypothetical protein
MLNRPLVREKVYHGLKKKYLIGEAQGRTESCLVGGDETVCTEIRREE